MILRYKVPEFASQAFGQPSGNHFKFFAGSADHPLKAPEETSSAPPADIDNSGGISKWKFPCRASGQGLSGALFGALMTITTIRWNMRSITGRRRQSHRQV